jgi:hypothetical protein
MSNIKIVNDAYGRPHPVKEEELFEYGIKPDGTTLGTSGGASSILNVVSGHLTAAEILDANATPIVLIPAPGANKVNVVVSYLARYNYETMESDGSRVNIYYSSGVATSDQIGDYLGNNMLAESNICATYGYYLHEGNPFPLSVINDDIVGYCPIPNTVGDGTVDYTIYYITYDISAW